MAYDPSFDAYYRPGASNIAQAAQNAGRNTISVGELLGIHPFDPNAGPYQAPSPLPQLQWQPQAPSASANGFADVYRMLNGGVMPSSVPGDGSYGAPQPGAPTTLGSLASGGPAVAPGARAPGGPNVAPAGAGGLGAGMLSGMGGMFGGGSGGGYTPQMGTLDPLGGAAGNGVGSIPGGQPNYSLDIGSYLNPMLKYQIANGANAITNSQAAAGMLNSGETLKSLLQYGMGVAAPSFNNAANIAQGQQQFAYGVDNNDRNFAFNAANSDRNFNLQNLLSQAQLGLGAMGQQGANSRQLAQLLASLGLGAANASSTGTIGAGNALTNSLSQIIANYLGGNVARNVLAQPNGATG